MLSLNRCILILNIWNFLKKTQYLLYLFYLFTVVFWQIEIKNVRPAFTHTIWNAYVPQASVSSVSLNDKVGWQKVHRKTCHSCWTLGLGGQPRSTAPSRKGSGTELIQHTTLYRVLSWGHCYSIRPQTLIFQHPTVTSAPSFNASRRIFFSNPSPCPPPFCGLFFFLPFPCV